MPFDGKRMIMGGFDAIVEEGSEPAAATPTASSCRCPRARRTPIARWRRRWPRSSASMARTACVEAIADDVPARQGHRLLSRGEGRGRREGRLLASSNGPTRQTRDEAWAEDHGGREPEARRRHAVRRPAHVLGRLRADPRQPPQDGRKRLTRRSAKERNDDRCPKRCAPTTSVAASAARQLRLVRTDDARSRRRQGFYDAVVGWNIGDSRSPGDRTIG